MAGLGHEQGRRDTVLAEMGRRTVAKLVQCPLPSRCFTEQRPRPLVGQPPPAVGASIQLGRNDIGPTRGYKERTSAAAGQVTGEEPCRRRVPHDDLSLAALAATRTPILSKKRVLYDEHPRVGWWRKQLPHILTTVWCFCYNKTRNTGVPGSLVLP